MNMENVCGKARNSDRIFKLLKAVTYLTTTRGWRKKKKKKKAVYSCLFRNYLHFSSWSWLPKSIDSSWGNQDRLLIQILAWNDTKAIFFLTMTPNCNNHPRILPDLYQPNPDLSTVWIAYPIWPKTWFSHILSLILSSLFSALWHKLLWSVLCTSGQIQTICEDAHTTCGGKATKIQTLCGPLW